MALTLAQIFGANVTQDGTHLTISKADLAGIGLTAQASNTPGSLLAAILIFAQQSATAAANTNDPTNDVVIANGYAALTTVNNQNYRQTQLQVSFYKTDLGSSLNPMDY